MLGNGLVHFLVLTCLVVYLCAAVSVLFVMSFLFWFFFDICFHMCVRLGIVLIFAFGVWYSIACVVLVFVWSS